MTDSYKEIDHLGNVSYYKSETERILHREDGPAVEGANGYKAWYLNDLRVGQSLDIKIFRDSDLLKLIKK